MQEAKKSLKSVIKTLDAANARLESTMELLRSTMVEAAFRPSSEEPRSLLDFVDEEGVETMRDALKESIRDSKVCYRHLISWNLLTSCYRKLKLHSIPPFYPLITTYELSRLL